MNIALLFETGVESIVYQNQAFALGMIKPNIQQYEHRLPNKHINCVADSGFNLYEKDVFLKDEQVLKPTVRL